MVRQKRKSKIKEVFLNYIKNHMKDFFVVTIIFIIGLMFGVIFINHMNEEQEKSMISYITEFVQKLQQDSTIDKGELLKKSVKSNLIAVIVMWFAGCTVIGIPILYGANCFRGFCLGYTISAIFATLKTNSAWLFSITTLLLQNILFIPALFALSVSGIQLYKSIMKDKAKMNIKTEIYRHTIFSCIIAIVMVASSFIEVYLSSNLFLFSVKHMSFL